MKKSNNGNKDNNRDFSKGAFWVCFSVLLVIAPVFLPYFFQLLQGKKVDMKPDALDISLLVYSVSCSLLYLCFECPHIKRIARKFNKIVSISFAIFSIVFYIHSNSSNESPDNIGLFICIGLFVIFYASISGYLMTNSENNNKDLGDNNA